MYYIKTKKFAKRGKETSISRTLDFTFPVEVLFGFSPRKGKLGRERSEQLDDMGNVIYGREKRSYY